MNQIEVSGPQVELAKGSAVAEVNISAAPAVAENNWRLAEDVIYRPSKMTWLAETDKSQDNH